MEKHIYGQLSDKTQLAQNFEFYWSDSYPELKIDKESFFKAYYRVWHEEFKVDLQEIEEKILWVKGRKWVDENLFAHGEAFYESLEEGIEWKSFEQKGKNAVVTRNSNLRILPTIKPLFENAHDYPFDMLQESMIVLGTPFKILGRTKNGRWSYGVTSSHNFAWIETVDIGCVSESESAYIMGIENYGVITRDETPLYAQGYYSETAFLGSIFPMHEASMGSILIPIKDFEGRVEYKIASVESNMAAFPLKFGKIEVMSIVSQLIQKPYGWGGMYQYRDCSATLKDYFACFGIFINRNSRDQVKNGQIISLKGMSTQEKRDKIKELATPFKTILHRPGHVMLYLGIHKDRIVVFHQFWRVIVKEGSESLNYHEHSSHITYLDAGVEHLGQNSTLFEATETMMAF